MTGKRPPGGYVQGHHGDAAMACAETTYPGDAGKLMAAPLVADPPAQTFIFLRQSSCYDWQLLRASDDRLELCQEYRHKVAVR